VNILLVHNYYRERGGEYRVFVDEVEMLRRHGHDVRTFTRHNDDTQGMNALTLARKTIWNREVYDEISLILQRDPFDIVHVHNTLALISPAVFHACRDNNVPVVQTLHNYRLVCANGLLFRNGAICEECLQTKLPHPALRYGCYRGSRIATAGVVATTVWHKKIGTWSDVVSGFITLNSSARDVYRRYGIPDEKLFIKPNAVDTRNLPGDGKGGYALYVGRLVPEKGVETLVSAWREASVEIPLKIVGDGRLLEDLKARAAGLPITFEGLHSRSETLDLMRKAIVLVFPSTCYEGFSRVPIEALAMGTPVLASRLGAVMDVVIDGKTGFFFNPGDSASLGRQMKEIESNPSALARMRTHARNDAVERFGEDANHRTLVSIYESVIRAD